MADRRTREVRHRARPTSGAEREGKATSAVLRTRVLGRPQQHSACRGQPQSTIVVNRPPHRLQDIARTSIAIRGLVQTRSSGGHSRALALATAGLLIFACNRSPTTTEAAGDVGAKVAQVAAAVTGQDAPIAKEVEAGRFLGFDTHTYPGDDKMRAWRNAPNAPYKWVGYYLPDTPCHNDKSWSGRRETLVKMGWGLAV